MIRKTVLISLILVFISSLAFSQMKRERVTTDEPVEMFWAPNIVGMGTVNTVPGNNLNVTIMHNFGLINQETFRNLFGLDLGATVRLGLDYGLTDRWSLGVGRTSPQKVYDFRSTYAFMRQTESGSRPLSLAAKADLGINTSPRGYDFEDRLSYYVSFMAARQFFDRLTLQVTPMYAYFNTVFTGDEKEQWAVGVGGEYHISDRLALMAEWYPVVGDAWYSSQNPFALGLNIETGGHVFQLFVKSTNWHTEQHILLNRGEEFWKGDIRFGFNVNRIFWFGEQ